MIIPFREEPETRGPDYPCSAFRWTFQTGRWFVGLIHQHQYRSDGTWHNSHTAVWSIAWNGWARFGFDVAHVRYDGPHCLARFGPFAIQWNNPGCRKCWGDE